nr:hypothetical protein [Tanacetum cinerariifolium]
PPLQLPSASRREDRPEVTLPPQKRLGIYFGPRYEVGESTSAAAARPARGLRADYGFVATIDREIMRDPEREVGYVIIDSWDEIVETLQGAPVSTDTELGGYMREFEMRVRQDTDEIYMRLDDEQTERQLLAGRLNMLFKDRRAHAYTRHLMETEPRMSREAWVRSTDASDLVRGEIPFPPLPSILSPPSPVLSPAPPPSPIRSLGYRAAMIRLRDDAASTSSPPLQLPSARESSSAARPAGGLRADYGFVDTIDREIMRDPEREIGYGITDSWDEMTERQLLAGRLNMLFRDRRAHAYTRHLMEIEDMMSREAWMSKIRELQAADRRRQTVSSELLRTDHRRSTEITELRTTIQGQVTALQGQVTALQAQVTTLQGQQGLAGGPTQP